MSGSESGRRIRRAVGAAAIILILIFTALAFTGYFNFYEWIIAALVVWVVANLIFRRYRKPP